MVGFLEYDRRAAQNHYRQLYTPHDIVNHRRRCTRRILAILNLHLSSIVQFYHFLQLEYHFRSRNFGKRNKKKKKKGKQKMLGKK